MPRSIPSSRALRQCTGLFKCLHQNRIATATGYEGLVRATQFKYSESPLASFITSVTQSGFKLLPAGTYRRKSLPPVEFTYSQAEIHDEIREIDAASLENLPMGLDGSSYQWGSFGERGNKVRLA